MILSDEFESYSILSKHDKYLVSVCTGSSAELLPLFEQYPKNTAGTYTFYVVAVLDGGDSGLSNPVTYTLGEENETDIPTNLKITGTTLTWTGVSGISDYRVYYKLGTGINYSQYIAVSGTSVNLATHITQAGSYSIKVGYRDPDGMGSDTEYIVSGETVTYTVSSGGTTVM